MVEARAPYRIHEFEFGEVMAPMAVVLMLSFGNFERFTSQDAFNAGYAPG